MTKKQFVQIGVASLRAPNGDFLPAQNIYIKVSEDLRESGLTGTEEMSLAEVGTLFADKFRQYKDGNKKAKLKL